MTEQPIIPHGQPGTYFSIIKENADGDVDWWVLKRTDDPAITNFVIKDTTSNVTSARMAASNALVRLRNGLVWEVLE